LTIGAGALTAIAAMTLTEDTILQALSAVHDPELGRSLVELGRIRNLHVDGTRVSLGVDLTSAASPLRDQVSGEVQAAVKAAGASEVTIEWGVAQVGGAAQAAGPCPGVENIILVVSGKGGVGKSTVAANLALGLARDGGRVGLLDADMYGPSVPTMFGVHEHPTATADGKIKPIERLGIKLMSIGFLLESETAAVIWRGPLLQGALMQFLNDVDWGSLDHLVLDLPPGTGDVAITLSQQVQGAAALIVTTPQQVALADVLKQASMLEKVGIAVLGVVENESYFVCDGCDKRHELFGSGGGQKVADFAKAPLIARIPIDPALRIAGDAGTPLVAAEPGSPAAVALIEAADEVAARCSAMHAERAPAITIDRSGGTNRHLPIAR